LQPQLPQKKWSRKVWTQLRNITKKKIRSLLDKDSRWTRVEGRHGAEIAYHNSDLPHPFDKLTIHPHSGARYENEFLLKQLLNQICWTEDTLREWKVIK
jgi:hypothetical protein